MIVSGVRRFTFLSKTNLCKDTTINLLIFNALTLFYKDNCNSGSDLNIFTILSALQILEYDPFLKYNTLILGKILIFPEINRKKETYDGKPSGCRSK